MANQRDTRVELLLDNVWTNVTSDVLFNELTISRGRADEAQAADASRCSLAFKNTDGKYSPRNPTSAYYGKIGRNTQLRVGVGVPPIAASTLGQTGTSLVAPSVTAEAAGRLFCVFSAAGPGNITLPGGMTGLTERDSTVMTCNAASADVSAGATGTQTATHSVSMTAGAAASVWIKGSITVAGFSGITTGADASTTFNVTAGQYMLIFHVWSSDPSDKMRYLPQTEDANMDWLLVHDSGPSSGQRIRAFLGRIDKTDSSMAVTLPGGGTGVDNYRAAFVCDGVTPYYPRFNGYVSSWPSRWEPSEGLVTVPVEASGVLRRLGQADSLASSLRRSMDTQGGIVAYWPCEDAEGSTNFASAVAKALPASFIGTPELAADDSYRGSTALPTFTGAGFRGVVPKHTTPTSYWVGGLVHFPAAGSADESTLFTVTATGSARTWTLKYDSGLPGLRLEAFDSDGASLLNDIAGPWSPTLPDSSRLVFIKLSTSGSDIAYEYWVISPDASAGQLDFGTVSGQTKGRITSVSVGAALNLSNDISIGHVFCATESPFAIGTDTIFTASIGFDGETAATRIRRLAREEFLDVYAEASVDSEQMGPQAAQPLVTLLQDAEALDLGQLYEPRGFAGLAYRSRESKENQTAALTLDYSLKQVSAPLEPEDDDQQTVNDVVVTREGGSSARAEDEDSVEALGRYSQSYSLNLYSDSQLADQAGWRVHMGTVGAARYPSVTVDLVANSSLIDSVASIEVGDKITLANLPVWQQPDDVELIVEGYTEQIVWPNVWTITLNCSPADGWDVTYETEARADSETTTLAEDLDTTETGIDIAVESGSALWVTTANNAAEFPFDVIVGGEVMTVTACSTTGATTQTMTVTRSVNGVVKSHSTGAKLSLANPVVFAF